MASKHIKALFGHYPTSGERVKRVWLDLARRAVPGKLVELYRSPTPSPPIHLPTTWPPRCQIDWGGVWGLRPSCIPDAHRRPTSHI